MQVKPDDAFGRQMVSNLESRGCPLLGLPATPSLEAHCGRLVDNGWSAAASWDMDTLYKVGSYGWSYFVGCAGRHVRCVSSVGTGALMWALAR